jgi:hypothetical protein
MSRRRSVRQPGEERGDDQEPIGAAEAEEVVWNFDDPDATWWDDVWPFRDDDRPVAPGNVPNGDDTVVPVSATPGTPEGPRSQRIPQSAETAEPVTDEDGDPTPMPAPWTAARAGGADPWWTRRFVWVSAVAVAVVTVSGLLWLRGGPESGDDARARLLRSATYDSPVALQPGTSYVRTRILPSGELAVTEWIRTRGPVDSVTARTPTVDGLNPATVSATHFVLAANGTRYPALPVAGAAAQTFRFPAVRTVYLSYRLTGAVQSSGPHGRALARLTALDVGTGRPQDSTTQEVVGARVLALACTPAPDVPPVPCGSVDRGTWTVRLRGARQRNPVMAQVDLF